MRRLLAALALALTAASGEQVFDLRIENGRLHDGPEVIRVHQGDLVVLRWHSDRTVTLHLHGYEIETRVAPGTAAETRFDARAAGRYPVHLHGAGRRGEAVLLYLEVHPD